MEVWSHRIKIHPNDFGNSLAGLQILSHVKIAGFEADISFSADKEIIIYHPGSKNPDLITLSLQEIISTKFPMMTLHDLLEFMRKNPGMKCCLDIKQSSEELVKKAVKLIVHYQLEKEIYLTTFQKKLSLLGIESGPELLEMARKICPKIKTHIIAMSPNNIYSIAKWYRPDIISFGWLTSPITIKLISLTTFQIIALRTDIKEQIKHTRKMNIKVLGGIVDHTDDIAYFADLGVDGVMTDCPYNTYLLVKNWRENGRT